jgi:predicted transcriptional regulator
MNKEITTRETDTLLEATSRIVAAYMSRPEATLEDLPNVVAAVQKALLRANTTSSTVATGQNPAVPISESIHDDYLVCLEDGKRLSMLKRHLNTTYGLSLEQYKERWGLPADYPTVSASYTRRRSAIAKTIGLGKTGRKGRGKARLQAVS